MNTKTSIDAPGSLIKETQALIKRDSRSLLEIHKATRIPFHWLRKFSANDMPNPSVNRVQFLYEKLSGKKIKL